MNISRFAVERPKLTMMVSLIVVIVGGMSLIRLPIDLMPDITYPTLNITAAYENASPEEVEQLITRPIEQAMSAVPGVEEVSSTSWEGRSRVRVSFSWGTDLDAASNDVRDRLDRVIPRLPDNADRPVLRKFDPSSIPVVILGASGNLDPIELRRIVEDQVKYRIERVPGVAALDVWGGLEREIHVSLDVDKINALGIPLDQIQAAIRAGNITLPAGTLERGNYEITVRTPGEYTDLSQIRETVVADRGGAPVRLGDIASVEDSSQRVTRIVRVNRRPGINMSVTKQSGTNTVEVARSVLEEVARINRDIGHIELIPIINTAEHIERSIATVSSSAVYGGLFAVLVLLFFLRNVRSTAIVAAAIPLSIVATFALIYFAGFTLNIMTLGGLALGIGMLVDNSIVVLENIYRMQESGKGAKEAAVEGSEEVTAAVIASTLTTVAIFLPLIFMEGMSGIMFKQLALIVSFALLCSLIVSLAVIPMLASKYLHYVPMDYFTRETPIRKLFRLSCNFFTALDETYRRLLRLALSRRPWVLGCAALILAGSFMMVPLVGVELMPSSDEGEVRIHAEAEVGTRLSVTDEKFLYIDSVIADEVPEMKSMVTNVGGGRWAAGSHLGNVRVALKPRSERARSSEEIAADLRRSLSQIPGMTVRARASVSTVGRMFGGGAGAEERIEVEVRGYDLETADALAGQIKTLVEGVEGVTDAQVSRESGRPEELVIVDRLRAADMGLTVASVARMLQTSLGGSASGYFREGGDEYRILLQLEGADGMDIEDVLDLTLVNGAGEPVMLRSVVDVRSHSGPVTIERKDQERIVSVLANTSGRDAGSIMGEIQEKLRMIPVPRGFTIGLTGEYEQQQETFGELTLVFILALLIVYMVMVSLYESYRDPFVVMFAVPPAAIGVIWMLFLTGTTFNMQSFIGCIMLAGIVVNNAIVLVDQMNLARQRDGMRLMDAIEEVGRRRLRPILMTAFTTMLALVPLALGMGEGGEFQAPLARAVIGGLFTATLITLVVVPIVYYLFERRFEHEGA